MAITSAITYGNNICHYKCGPKCTTVYKTICQKLWQKLLPQYLDITLFSMLYGLTPAITKHVNICVQYCKTHITHTPSWIIIILGKHFPQTRRSHDRDLAKACLSNQNLSPVLEKIDLIHVYRYPNLLLSKV